MNQTTCSIEGCDGPIKARGWCNKHYRRWRRYGDISKRPSGFVSRPAEERFWERVVKLPSGCWQWTGSLACQGYGRIRVNEERTFVHRFAYELLVAPIPDGMEIDHLCRNRGCVNPDHLEPVTRKENILRGVSPSAQHARQTHCVNGHPLDEFNAPVSEKTGKRRCRTCMRHQAARRNARKNA